MKRCTKCGAYKELCEFYDCKHHKDGKESGCKECKKEYRLKNKERFSKRDKERYLIHCKEINNHRRKLRIENIEIYREKQKEYRKIHRDKINEQQRQWRMKNHAKKKVFDHKYYIANKNKKLEGCRIWKMSHPNWSGQWYKLHPDKIKEYTKRRLSNDQYRLSNNISRGISRSIRKGLKNGAHWEKLVDFNILQLKRRLEKQFQPGMTWDNYGKWHVDHRIPKSAFNFNSPKDLDFKRCWSLKNLQPMWAKDNIEKKDKLEKPFQPSLLLRMS